MRMDEAERLRVQRLPGQDVEEIVVKRPPFGRVRAISDRPTAVGRIAEDGVAEVASVDADLVRPSYEIIMIKMNKYMFKIHNYSIFVSHNSLISV